MHILKRNKIMQYNYVNLEACQLTERNVSTYSLLYEFISLSEKMD